ncbi:flavodoxin domain-containing protein, partial [Clostridium sp.]|uniref:flavodoxin domain-containing protein n=1 Tax=Clostridium sp. TaxID=1506 RepID=UPI00346464F8
MKTLIVYASKHGCAEKCALRLSEKLKESTDIFNIKDKKNIDFDNYNKIIIGGSIYIGNIQKEVKRFCLDNIEILKNKKIGFYICSM